MTYRQLLDQLDSLDDDQLDMKVQASIDDEFFPIIKVSFHEGHDRLVDGHPYIEVE